FWMPWLADPAVGRAEGFPGGVRALVVGEQTYTVLCGDGSVWRRLLPDRAATGPRDHPERGCLAVAPDSVYFRLGRALCRLSPDGQMESVVDNPVPLVQAGAVSADAVVVRDAAGAVSLLQDQALTPVIGSVPLREITDSRAEISGSEADLLAADRG